MAASLDAHEKRERKLTRDVAHELRTPLANVSSYLEAITEGICEYKVNSYLIIFISTLT